MVGVQRKFPRKRRRREVIVAVPREFLGTLVIDIARSVSRFEAPILLTILLDLFDYSLCE